MGEEEAQNRVVELLRPVEDGVFVDEPLNDDEEENRLPTPLDEGTIGVASNSHPIKPLSGESIQERDGV